MYHLFQSSPPQKGRDEATGLALHGLRLNAAAPSGGEAGLLSRLAGPKLAIHTFKLSEDHAPGLHWYRVGSDGQGGPGFRGAFYVLPRGQEEAVKERSSSSSSSSGSKRSTASSVMDHDAGLLLLQHEPETEAYLVNGQRPSQAKEQAVINVRAGEARVLDLAHAGGPHLLEVGVEGEGPDCSLRLLALDGVALQGGPREVVGPVGLAALQRASVLLTCRDAGQAALVARPAAATEEDSAQSWEQRLLSVSVTKGLGQLLSFNRRLPLLPTRPRSSSSASVPEAEQQGQEQAQHEARPWYLRDLTNTLAPLDAAACVLSLACPPAASCPAGHQACEPQHASATGSSSLRELTVTLAHPVPPAAAVRLAPARPFQILDFAPGKAGQQQEQQQQQHEGSNAYVHPGGTYKQSFLCVPCASCPWWRPALSNRPPLISTNK